MLLSFCLNPIAFVALRLGRFWCETGAVTPARADELRLTSIGLYRRTLFRMIIQRVDLALSRLKQGFDSPRERQPSFSHFDFPSFFAIFPKLLGVVWGDLFARCSFSFTTARFPPRLRSASRV